eukprot:scaffold109914_cov63-Phaeocystis_antarctica.AAC.2
MATDITTRSRAQMAAIAQQRTSTGRACWSQSSFSGTGGSSIGQANEDGSSMQLTSDATATGDKPRRLTVARRGATVTGACCLSGAWKAAAAATARASMPSLRCVGLRTSSQKCTERRRSGRGFQADASMSAAAPGSSRPSSGAKREQLRVEAAEW